MLQCMAIYAYISISDYRCIFILRSPYIKQTLWEMRICNAFFFLSIFHFITKNIFVV